MEKQSKRSTEGQSLIEIVVAVGIIVVVLVGVSDLITRSLGLSTFQKNTNIAVNIAQNQLTYYRQQRDQNPTDFFANLPSNKTCVSNPSPTKYGCNITYDLIGSPATGVSMKVKIVWNDGDKTINTELSQDLAIPTK